MTMKKKNTVTWLIFLLALPATLLLGSKLPGRWYYLTGTLMILELLIPFFLTFEDKKPQARELVMLAVMCALAVAARVVIPIPHFKAIYGIIMIAGISFGPERGFLVGAIAALSSNFFMGQGPYTPWQMMSYGTGGMLMGYLFQPGRLPRKPLRMAIIGALISLLIMGPILDTCTLFWAPVKLTWKTLTAVYLSGAAVNISLSVSTFLVLFLLGSPLLQKLDRVKTKYGMTDNE